MNKHRLERQQIIVEGLDQTLSPPIKIKNL